MDNGEAEAVLLALGDALQWERYLHARVLDDIPDAKNTVEIAVTAVDSYSILLQRHNWFFRTYKAKHLSKVTYLYDVSQSQYRRKAEAKAACERHHATGKWDS